MDKGIDYGLGKTNVDNETGIRYGVIPAHTLEDWIWEEFEHDYGKPHCPACGSEIFSEPVTGNKDHYCDECNQDFYSEEVYPDSPVSIFLDKDGYQAEVDEYNDIFVFKSPYYTHAQYCSPCAPGACYLMNSTPEGDKAYCFNGEWFPGGKAPYPVYSVKTGKLVKTKED